MYPVHDEELLRALDAYAVRKRRMLDAASVLATFGDESDDARELAIEMLALALRMDAYAEQLAMALGRGATPQEWDALGPEATLLDTEGSRAFSRLHVVLEALREAPAC